jgi:hypothetical protein
MGMKIKTRKLFCYQRKCQKDSLKYWRERAEGTKGREEGERNREQKKPVTSRLEAVAMRLAHAQAAEVGRVDVGHTAILRLRIVIMRKTNLFILECR